jgi:hypothetical protein
MHNLDLSRVGCRDASPVQGVYSPKAFSKAYAVRSAGLEG